MIANQLRRTYEYFNRDAGDAEPHSEAKACRGLLAGVLERSFRDLSPDSSSQHRREAIAWFKAREPRNKTERYFLLQSDIPYWLCVEVLELSAAQLLFLNEKIREADEYQKKISVLDEGGIERLKESMPRVTRYHRRTPSPLAYELA